MRTDGSRDTCPFSFRGGGPGGGISDFVHVKVRSQTDVSISQIHLVFKTESPTALQLRNSLTEWPANLGDLSLTSLVLTLQVCV